MTAIQTESLTVTYGSLRAVDEVSLAVESGEVFGYLGPNGAGKTTTIRTLLGLQSPTSGSARVLGHDVTDERELVAAKRRIGYLPSSPAFDPRRTGRAVLDLHESVKGGARREALLDRFDPPLDRAVRAYSGGNVQKLGLVQAFMHDPDVVVLDEPTSGLDPLMQRSFNEFLRNEVDRGTAAFMSSHVLSEVRRVCDRVGVLRDGRLVTVDRVADVLDRSGARVRLRTRRPLESDAVALDGVSDLSVRPAETADGSEVSFTYAGDVDALVDFLADRSLLDLHVEEAPLEEVFAGYYGGSEGGDGSAERTDDGTGEDGA